MRRVSLGLVLVFILVHVSCTGTTKSTGGSTPPPPQIAVHVAPTAANVRLGAAQPFTATVTGTTNQSVTWSVNGVVGGNSTVGLITNTGAYTAPAALTNPNTITISATSAADSSAKGTSDVTLWNATPVLSNVSPGTFHVRRIHAYIDRQQIRERRASFVRRRGDQYALCFRDATHCDGFCAFCRNICGKREQSESGKQQFCCSQRDGNFAIRRQSATTRVRAAR